MLVSSTTTTTSHNLTKGHIMSVSVTIDGTVFTGKDKVTVFKAMVIKGIDVEVAEAALLATRGKVKAEKKPITQFKDMLRSEKAGITYLLQSLSGLSAKVEDRKADWKRKALKSLDSYMPESGKTRREKFELIISNCEKLGYSVPAEVLAIGEK